MSEAGTRPPIVLTVAGSDSGGGAGIQADLKTFQELGVYGMSVITAITAQNSVGVQRLEPVSAEMVEAQLVSVLGDIGADAVKTGMLPTRAHVETIAATIRRYKPKSLVVDTVYAAKDGSALMGADAFEAMKAMLLPLAEVATPNLPEACRLLGMRETDIRSVEDMEQAAFKLLSFGPRHVLLKGGHFSGAKEAIDVFVGPSTSEPARRISGIRHATSHTHGTGCTTASAVAAYIAQGFSPEEACRLAKSFVSGAIAAAFPTGAGTGSLWHGAWRDLRE
ncbi:bifunctional hydroxymethylpyrimidine kinase/phosphomethylpyrimidine kinase [Cohnella panacarvi]|uniref:bifunctional hydroxymethylpyrimidine kinase/phosphomethylpyrimidine kinase n=1 Tax=Cohnella panacarvi TaxID=400776 RepID=UPI000478907D|nr:bifunctional hydroxymethylpyrimidine kinase/phosphomethylpyrimidine kinase [Cohnella panacarvi]